ncbi:MAG: hypothetical protein NTW68_11755 [candidate division NC10 bacterium]|nr:hypothetical protein [candidate division NC10 bacterium]
MNRTEPDGYLKAKAILAEVFPDRVDRLDPHKAAQGTGDAIMSALSEEYGVEKAADIGFHMSDWNSDAAFILALHLFPERFTKEEIQDGVTDFLIHAPNHVAEAAKLLGFPVSDIFKEDK